MVRSGQGSDGNGGRGEKGEVGDFKIESPESRRLTAFSVNIVLSVLQVPAMLH